MKKIILFVALFTLMLSTKGQNAIFTEFPPFPSTISQDEVQAFIDKLSALKESYDSRISTMEKENDEAATHIDAAKIAAQYSGQMSTTEIQNSKKANDDLQKNRQIFDNTLLKLSATKDSLLVLYTKDSDKQRVIREEYMNMCGGESSGNQSECAALLKKVNEGSTMVLKKYFFGKESLYTGYLINFRQQICNIHQVTTKDALTITEKNTMITFPHKDDLAVLKMAVDVILEMKSVYSVESYLWPL